MELRVMQSLYIILPIVFYFLFVYCLYNLLEPQLSGPPEGCAAPRAAGLISRLAKPRLSPAAPWPAS